MNTHVYRHMYLEDISEIVMCVQQSNTGLDRSFPQLTDVIVSQTRICFDMKNLDCKRRYIQNNPNTTLTRRMRQFLLTQLPKTAPDFFYQGGAKKVLS